MNTRPDDEVAVEAALERGRLERRRASAAPGASAQAFGDAGRALGRGEVPLARRAAGPVDELGRVDDEVPATTVEVVAVHAPRRRPFDPFATDVVLRAVARALEPAGRVAERDPAAEMRALLREGVDGGAGVGDEQAALGDVGGGLGLVAARGCRG